MQSRISHFTHSHTIVVLFLVLLCPVMVPSVMLIGLLRYAHVIEKHENSILNTFGLLTAWICAAGLIMVGNFQVATLTAAAQLVALMFAA